MSFFWIDFLQCTIEGILTGILYGLICVSFIIIFRTGKIFNFAQGEILIFGGYFILTFYSLFSFPLWLSLLAAFLCMVIIGLVIVLAGGLLIAGKIPFFGRLPGNIVVTREHLTLYFPIVSMLIIGAVISVILFLMRK